MNEDYLVVENNEVIEEQNGNNTAGYLVAGTVGLVVGVLASKGFKLVKNKIGNKDQGKERKFQMFNLKEDKDILDDFED